MIDEEYEGRCTRCGSYIDVFDVLDDLLFEESALCEMCLHDEGLPNGKD